MLRKILHLDMDAFFCAVEELRDPSLRGKPLAVGRSPDQRGVVASCSYAARRFGIHGLIAAMPAIAGKQPDTGFLAQTPPVCAKFVEQNGTEHHVAVLAVSLILHPHRHNSVFSEVEEVESDTAQ